jgi:ABC-type antimicrobial peptide transport system permease subunit
VVTGDFDSNMPQQNRPESKEPPHAIWGLLSPWVWLQFLRQTWLNIRASKTHYALGFAACWLVVVVVAVLVSLLNQTPVIFLRLAETARSEIDLQLDAADVTGFSRLNYTLVKSILTEPNEQHSSPRTLVGRVFMNPRNCPYASLDDTSWLYTPKADVECRIACPIANCPMAHYTSASTVTLDIKREEEILVGRNWKLKEPLGPGEVYLSSQLSNMLQAPEGTYIYGRFNASIGGRRSYTETVLQYTCPDCATNATKMMLAEMVWVPFKVKGVFSDVAGKFRRDSESYKVLLDHETMMSHVAKFINPSVVAAGPETIRNYTKTNLNDYVTTILINLPPPRIETYLTSKYSVIHDRLIAFSNTILYKVGFAQVEVDMPVLRGLAGTETVSLFLGLILNVIIFILLFLSVVLIYSLLMISVETRTFEMGILRMIGMARPSLIALLLVQAFAYAIPAWTIGMLTALLTYYGASSAVINLTQATISRLVSPGAFGLATLVGFIVPVASSIFPIRSALGQNLQDSLDVKHNKTKAVEITLKRGEDVSAAPWTRIMVGFGLSFFGAIIYYILPFGLLSANLALLMNIFLFILIGMLLGLVLVALNLQHMLERSLAMLFFFWESRGIRNLVVKNLVAHRKRNQKTSILYALSLGFIIFINIAYQIQVSSISEDKKREAGAYMLASAWGNIDPQTGRVPALYSKDLEYVKRTFPEVIEDFTWITKELRDSYPNAVNLQASNLGRWNFDTQRVYGVSPNFFRTAFSDYVIPRAVRNQSMNSDYMVDVLYSRDGNARAIFGGLYQSYFGLKPGDPLLLRMENTVGTSSEPATPGASSGMGSGGGLGVGGGSSGGDSAASANAKRTTEYLASAEGFLDSAPFFTFSSFPLVKGQDLLVSFSTFNSLSGFHWKSVEEIPLRAFLVKFKKGATQQQLDDVHDWMANTLPSDVGAGVWDYRDEMEPFEIANRAIFYFFSFTTIVAMAISFFSLMSSMYTNIKEQTKEIGVIRALGIPKSWVYRIYIYEAFLLVVASSLLGIVIGTITSYTMNSQQSLFTQLPLAFNFPYLLLFIVLSCSVVFALLSSFSPIRSVLGNRIVQILRGL